jgi:hypothetical protein
MHRYLIPALALLAGYVLARYVPQIGQKVGLP